LIRVEEILALLMKVVDVGVVSGLVNFSSNAPKAPADIVIGTTK
jgi:hypothetical protein